jgi:carbon monoxide dehydrogenase subunit G
MPKLERTVRIAAPPSVVWRVMIDVKRWPEWTPSIRSVKPQGAGAFGTGSVALVTPRGRPESPWTVTAFEPERSFTWETKVGERLWVLAGHVIEPDSAGARVTLSISTRGRMAPLLGWLIARMSRRNVDEEAAGLKRRSEEQARLTG